LGERVKGEGDLQRGMPQIILPKGIDQDSAAPDKQTPALSPGARNLGAVGPIAGVEEKDHEEKVIQIHRRCRYFVRRDQDLEKKNMIADSVSG